MPKVMENRGKMDKTSVKIDLGTAFKTCIVFSLFFMDFGVQMAPKMEPRATTNGDILVRKSGLGSGTPSGSQF